VREASLRSTPASTFRENRLRSSNVANRAICYHLINGQHKIICTNKNSDSCSSSLPNLMRTSYVLTIFVNLEYKIHNFFLQNLIDNGCIYLYILVMLIWWYKKIVYIFHLLLYYHHSKKSSTGLLVLTLAFLETYI
jgi:hypothetical protein